MLSSQDWCAVLEADRRNVALSPDCHFGGTGIRVFGCLPLDSRQGCESAPNPFQRNSNKGLVHARSTWSVTAVTCDLHFVGTSILAQLTAVLLVRPCLTLARWMCTFLCFHFCHDSSLSLLPDGTPAQRWMQDPATGLDGEWPQTRIRRRSYGRYCFGRCLDKRGVIFRAWPRRLGPSSPQRRLR